MDASVCTYAEFGGDMTDEVFEAEQKVQETVGEQSNESIQNGSSDQQYEPLTVVYERLRHSTDSQELSEFAHRPLPDRSDQAGFSRATALLEAVAGNPHTPEEDRMFLAQNMPFPNILVKLSQDSSAKVRCEVAKNTADKNWLVGRLTKDSDAQVRQFALRNPQTSWKMRLEGAQSELTDSDTLAFLATFGTEENSKAPAVLAAMIRRAVALNPNTDNETLQKLVRDTSSDVASAARERMQHM